MAFAFKERKKRSPTCSMVGWKLSLDSLLFFLLLFRKVDILPFKSDELYLCENNHQMERENLRSRIIDIIYYYTMI
jgi:hypothetical protein